MKKILDSLALSGEKRDEVEKFLEEVFSESGFTGITEETSLDDLPLLIVLLLFLLVKKVNAGEKLEVFKVSTINILAKEKGEK